MTRAQDAILAPVVVSAARLEQPLIDALPHTTVISRADIERAQVVDLRTLLQREAGVQTTANGGPGASGGLFIRGAPSSQVLLLVDGVPMTKQDATGSVSLEHLMLDQIERVEIVRGNVSALYGSGAVGGLIQVFTRRGTGAPQLSASAEAGARGSYRAAASVQGKSGATGYALALSHFNTDGISAQDAATNPAINPDNDGYRNSSIAASLTHDINAEHRLGAQLSYSDGKTDYDSAFAASPLDEQRQRSKLLTARASLDSRFSADWNSSLALTRLSDDQRVTETGDFGYDGRYRTTTNGLQWNHTLALDGLVATGWQGTGGIDAQRQKIDVDDGFGGLYAKERDVWAAYAGLSGRVGEGGAHSLQANVRFDHVEGTDNATTGYLGYGYALSPQIKLLASVSNAFNAPPLGYLYAPYFGNPALKPERARSAELGLQWTPSAEHWLRAALFASRVKDEFQYVISDPVNFIGAFENVRRTRNEGLELSYRGNLANTTLIGSFTRQDPRDDDSGDALLRRSKTLAALSVDQRFGAASVGAAWRYAGSRTDIGDVKLDAYQLFDLTASWRFGAALAGAELFARIENAADETYQTANGYPQPGRGFFAGLRWRGGW